MRPLVAIRTACAKIRRTGAMSVSRPAADTAREHVELVELSPGLIVLSLGPVGAAPRVSHAGRVRLFDVHGRAIQDVGPSSATDRLLHAQAQNGSLFLVTRSGIDVFGAK